MIEGKVTKNNLPTIAIQGVSLSSMYDPIKEAKQWVEAQRVDSESTCAVFVLGLAGGYQVEELALQNPQVEIIVLELRPQVIQWFWKRAKRQLKNLRIVNAAKEVSLQRFSKELQSPYRVIRNPYSVRLDGSQLISLEETLLGRSPKSIQKMRGIHKAFKNVKVDDSILEKDELVGIHQIEVLMKRADNSEMREKQIWASLRELVQ